MPMQIVRPHRVLPEELDRYLAQGWYRIGQTMIACRYLLYNGVLRSAVWTRSPLDRVRFGRGSRRLMARNDALFRTSVGPVRVDDAHERVYAAYCGWVKGYRPPTLRQYLWGDGEGDAFETQEISLWHGSNLVGFALFDAGRNSLQSLAGVFDPAFEKHSLGFYSMLKEIQHAQALGLAYHYAGYVLPGEPAMDYKLRVGGIEGLDGDTWRPFEQLDPETFPTRRLERALQRAMDLLVAPGLTPVVRLYSAYDLPAHAPLLHGCVDEPLFIELRTRKRAVLTDIVTYDLERDLYRVLHCQRAVVRSRDADPDEPGIPVLVVESTLGETRDPSELVFIVSS